MTNIYHLLNSREGYTVKSNLLFARKLYNEGSKNYWHYEEVAQECIYTLLFCNIITLDEYKILSRQLSFLCRLYKGKRGEALGRKDVF